MSWGEIFFGFNGRINRKVYWLGSLLVTAAGLCFNALLSYLATGHPLAPDVWQRAADKSGLWVPVWLAYFLFIAWPSSALAIKRLHDRDRPLWLWYVYFAAMIVLSLVPAKVTSPTISAAILTLVIFGVYVVFELSVLRGVAGSNAFGADPMPVGYHGGDYSFWSWMLALEGRISRRKWWIGIGILAVIAIAASAAMGVAVTSFIARHPEFEQNIANPEWAASPEAAPLLLTLGLWTALPMLAYTFVMWSLLALGVKRLHDRGLSSWLILVVVVPFFGAIVSPELETVEPGQNIVPLAFLLLVASIIWGVLQFGIFKGETGPNGHGPDPLAGR